MKTTPIILRTVRTLWNNKDRIHEILKTSIDIDRSQLFLSIVLKITIIAIKIALFSILVGISIALILFFILLELVFWATAFFIALKFFNEQPNILSNLFDTIFGFM